MNQSNEKPKKDFNKEQTCRNPNHNVPTHLYLPIGKIYVHVCPECGKATTINSANIQVKK